MDIVFKLFTELVGAARRTVELGICNNDYSVNIGQVTSSRLCRVWTNLRILSEISRVSRNKQNEGKISILGSQKSKKVTKTLDSHQ